MGEKTTEMRRVLVAGATGYLGGFVVRELKTRGYFVRALARSPEKLEHLRDSVDEVVVGEVTRATEASPVSERVGQRAARVPFATAPACAKRAYVCLRERLPRSASVTRRSSSSD